MYEEFAKNEMNRIMSKRNNGTEYVKQLIASQTKRPKGAAEHFEKMQAELI